MQGLRRHRRELRRQRGDDLLRLGLADDAETRRGGDEIAEDAEREGGRGVCERDAVPGRRRGDRDRVGDRPAGERLQRRAGPSGAGGGEERGALRRRLQPALARARERDGECR